MKYIHQTGGWRSYRYKRIELSPAGEEELRRWRAKSDAKLRADFPEYFAKLDRRKNA